jgi:hypothetical protein
MIIYIILLLLHIYHLSLNINNVTFMRKNHFSLSRTKSAFLFVCMAAGIAVTIPACKKDDNQAIENTAVTEGQAVNVVSTAMVDANGGLVSQINHAAFMAIGMSETREGAKLSDWCGLSLSDTTSGSGSASGQSYNYLIGIKYEVVCINRVPSNINFDFASQLGYSNAEASGQDSAVAVMKITGIADKDTALVFNTKYDRAGKLTSKTSKFSSFDHTLSYASSNITVSKTAREIVSGSATLTISGKDENGNTYSYAGTITFKGGKKATLAITGGASHELTWK